MNVRSLLATALAVSTGFLPLTGIADSALIKGKVVIDGKTPQEKPISMGADPVCAMHHPTPPKTEHFIVGEGNGLGNVFVYVKSGLTKKYTPPTTPVVLDQRDCLYFPYVMGVQVGQTLQIKNSDATLHNVNCQAKENEAFNISQPKKDTVNDKVFAKPEIMITFKCDVHKWMYGYVGVLDHPFFAVTDKDGNFELKNLPAGEYEIGFWHQKAAAEILTQKVTVAEGESKVVSMSIKAPEIGKKRRPKQL